MEADQIAFMTRALHRIIRASRPSTHPNICQGSKQSNHWRSPRNTHTFGNIQSATCTMPRVRLRMVAPSEGGRCLCLLVGDATSRHQALQQTPPFLLDADGHLGSSIGHGIARPPARDYAPQNDRRPRRGSTKRHRFSRMRPKSCQNHCR